MYLQPINYTFLEMVGQILTKKRKTSYEQYLMLAFVDQTKVSKYVFVCF